MYDERFGENIDQQKAVRYNAITVALTLATATQVYVRSPVRGYIKAVYTVLNGTLTTADEILTVKNNAGTSLGTITLTQSGSAVGDKDALTLTAEDNDTLVQEGHNIEVETGGQNGTASTCTITIVIDSKNA